MQKAFDIDTNQTSKVNNITNRHFHSAISWKKAWHMVVAKCVCVTKQRKKVMAFSPSPFLAIELYIMEDSTDQNTEVVVATTTSTRQANEYVKNKK
jgi:hypothetical protein